MPATGRCDGILQCINHHLDSPMVIFPSTAYLVGFLFWLRMSGWRQDLLIWAMSIVVGHTASDSTKSVSDPSSISALMYPTNAEDPIGRHLRTEHAPRYAKRRQATVQYARLSCHLRGHASLLSMQCHVLDNRARGIGGRGIAPPEQISPQLPFAFLSSWHFSRSRLSGFAPEVLLDWVRMCPHGCSISERTLTL